MSKLNYQRTARDSSLSRQKSLKSMPSELGPIVKTPKFKPKSKPKKTQLSKKDFTKHPLVGSVKFADNRLPQSAKTIMPYGKYKGYQYQDLPLEYVHWALLNISDTVIKEKMIAEIKKRSDIHINKQ